jgi:hypothetical protein
VLRPRNALIFNQYVAWSYFDGTIQGFPTQCGVGMVLFLSQEHFYCLKLGVGTGTNF